MNNDDLKELEKEINDRKALAETQSAVPVVVEEQPQPPKQVDAGELVGQAFNAAIVKRVQENTEVQDEILHNADKVIDNKVQALVAKAEQESKEAHFNNKKSACECFGYNETTTEKWAVNAMNVWHNIMTAIWLFIGFFTFAPVTFIAKKISVIFKKSWVALVLAILIYAAVILVPLLTGLLV